MRVGFNSILNFLALLLLVMISAGFETTVWFQFMGSIPGPMIWLSAMVYLSLYRRPLSGILSIYFLSFSLVGFSLIPLKMLWFPLVMIFFFTHTIKSRVFWSGAGYFVLMCIASSFIYHIGFILTSKWLEPNMATISFLDRTVQIFLTPLFAWPTYRILHFVDRITQTEDLQNSGGIEI